MNNNNTTHEEILNTIETSTWGQYDYQDVLKAMKIIEKKLLEEIKQLNKQIQNLQNQN